MSRLLWFLVGASFATVWAERKNTEGGGPWCHAQAWRQRRGQIEGQTTTFGPSSSSEQCNKEKKRSMSAPPIPAPPNSSQVNWEIEAERLRRQAGDAAADFSEATIVTLQNTLEQVKTKLQQHKVQREAMREREEERKTPPRYV